MAANDPMFVYELALAIWCQDGRSPFYLSPRVGRGNRDFAMIKLRTMVVGADRTGASSAAKSDARITPFGRFLRRWKLDELPQVVNVLAGHMSIVGPRPNVRLGGVNDYTREEMGLLAVRPGLTDLASIVFADEAEILSIAMAAKERGRGLSRGLLATHLGHLAGRGVRTVFLEVEENNQPARRLYEKAGFAVVGRRERYYREAGGEERNALVMRRDLS